MTHRISAHVRHRLCCITMLVGFALAMPLAAPLSGFAAPALPTSGRMPLIAKPASKLSARLHQLAEPSLQTANTTDGTHAMSFPQDGPNSVLMGVEDEVLAYIRVADTAPATLQALTQRGARIVHVAAPYQTVTAYVRAPQLNAVANLDAVYNLREVLRPRVAGNGVVPRHRRTMAPRADSCPSGIVSEGDELLGAARARSMFGVDGTGITIGVLSDSYNVTTATATTAQQDITTADLPGPGNPCGFTTPVNVLEDFVAQQANTVAGTDEGRAMLQIVHDLAPASTLAFATAQHGLFSFADNIRALQQAGAQVIVDDVNYLDEPAYQDGPINQAIQDVTNAGVLYFTAAGNDNVIDAQGNLVGSYEAVYRPTACGTITYPNQTVAQPGGDCQNFAPAQINNLQAITVQPGGNFWLTLQWSEPWYGVTSDFDLYLVDPQAHLTHASMDRNSGLNGTQRPFERVYYRNATATPQTINILVARYSGTGTPRIKYTFFDGEGISATTFNATNSTDIFGPTVYAHGMEDAALSVAAVSTDDADVPAEYTSHGPGTLYFAPVRDAQPAAALGTPVVRQKPDIAAIDGVTTTFFEEQEADGSYQFYGTSAAAPHAAAIGALMLQQSLKVGAPLNQTQMTHLMITNAAPVLYGTPASVGAGLLNATQAVGAITIKPVVMLPLVQR